MRRFISIILVFVMLLSMASISSAAIIPIDPMYTYVNSVYASLTIDPTWGVATCTGSASAKTNNNVRVAVYLQQNVGGNWRTLKSWTKSAMWTAVASGSYAVYHGYTYRTLVTGYILDSNGNVLETASVAHEVDFP